MNCWNSTRTILVPRRRCGALDSQMPLVSQMARVSQIVLATVVMLLAARFTQAAERRLTDDGRLKSSPVFVDRTGTEIVYVVEESPVLLRLMRYSLVDGSQRPVHPDQTKSEFEPSFSADGKWMAHVQSRGNLSLGIVIHDLNSKTESVINPAGGFSGPRGPALLPDGSSLLYCFSEKEGQQIRHADNLARNARVVIDTPGIATAPDFSADGQRFTFSSTRDGNYEIYTAQLDGSDLRRLTKEPRQDMRPRYSPDGQQIAFTSARDGNYELYLMCSDGSNVRRITHSPERDDYPAWHPSGQKLIYVSERNGRHDLYQLELP